jgi:hypothetical protein
MKIGAEGVTPFRGPKVGDGYLAVPHHMGMIQRMRTISVACVPHYWSLIYPPCFSYTFRQQVQQAQKGSPPSRCRM